MPFVTDNLSDLTSFDGEKRRYTQSLNKKWSADIAKPMKLNSQPDTSDKADKPCSCSVCYAQSKEQSK